MSLWPGKTHARRLPALPDALLFHGPRRPGEGLDGTRDSLAYASWVMVSTLPSLSLNQAALPAGVAAMAFTV